MSNDDKSTAYTTVIFLILVFVFFVIGCICFCFNIETFIKPIGYIDFGVVFFALAVISAIIAIPGLLVCKIFEIS